MTFNIKQFLTENRIPLTEASPTDQLKRSLDKAIKHTMGLRSTLHQAYALAKREPALSNVAAELDDLAGQIVGIGADIEELYEEI